MVDIVDIGQCFDGIWVKIKKIIVFNTLLKSGFVTCDTPFFCQNYILTVFRRNLRNL